jgi:ferrous iron transport protein A
MKRRHHIKKHFIHRKALAQPGYLPLSALDTGEKGVVTGIAGGHGMLERMTSLGFVPGTEVIMLQNFNHGPIIVRAHDARIALGRGIAFRIQITRSET